MTIDAAIRELRHLNQLVPLPRRLPTPQEVDAVQQLLGFRFPADYRKFLLEASDVAYGTYEPAVVDPRHDYRDLERVARHGWQWGVPETWLPFCEDNSDFYCLDASGIVHFWSHNGPTEENWPNLATWITEVWIGGS